MSTVAGEVAKEVADEYDVLKDAAKVAEVAFSGAKKAESVTHAAQAVERATNTARTVEEGAQALPHAAGKAAAGGLAGIGAIAANFLMNDPKKLILPWEWMASRNVKKAMQADLSAQAADHIVAKHVQRVKSVQKGIGEAIEAIEANGTPLTRFSDGMARAADGVATKLSEADARIRGLESPASDSVYARVAEGVHRVAERVQHYAGKGKEQQLTNLRLQEAEVGKGLGAEHLYALGNVAKQQKEKALKARDEFLEKAGRWGAPGNKIFYTPIGDLPIIDSIRGKEGFVGRIADKLGISNYETSAQKLADARNLLTGVMQEHNISVGGPEGPKIDGKPVAAITDVASLQRLGATLEAALEKADPVVRSTTVRNASVDPRDVFGFQAEVKALAEALQATTGQAEAVSAEATKKAREAAVAAADGFAAKAHVRVGQALGDMREGVQKHLSDTGSKIASNVQELGTKREHKAVAQMTPAEAVSRGVQVAQMGIGAVTTARTAHQHVERMKALYAEANGVAISEVSFGDLTGANAPEAVRKHSGVGVVARVLPSLAATALAMGGETVADAYLEKVNTKAAWGLRAVSRVSGLAAPFLQSLVPNAPVLQYHEALGQSVQHGTVSAELVQAYATAFQAGLTPKSELETQALLDLSDRYAHALGNGTLQMAELTQALHKGSFARQMEAVAAEIVAENGKAAASRMNEAPEEAVVSELAAAHAASARAATANVGGRV